MLPPALSPIERQPCRIAADLGRVPRDPRGRRPASRRPRRGADAPARAGSRPRRPRRRTRRRPAARWGRSRRCCRSSSRRRGRTRRREAARRRRPPVSGRYTRSGTGPAGPGISRSVVSATASAGPAPIATSIAKPARISARCSSDGLDRAARGDQIEHGACLRVQGHRGLLRFLEPGHERAQRPAPVRQRVLLVRRHLRERAAVAFERLEDRVVAEAAGAPRLDRDETLDLAPDDELVAVGRRGPRRRSRTARCAAAPARRRARAAPWRRCRRRSRARLRSAPRRRRARRRARRSRARCRRRPRAGRAHRRRRGP